MRGSEWGVAEALQLWLQDGVGAKRPRLEAGHLAGQRPSAWRPAYIERWRWGWHESASALPSPEMAPQHAKPVLLRPPSCHLQLWASVPWPLDRGEASPPWGKKLDMAQDVTHGDLSLSSSTKWDSWEHSVAVQQGGRGQL